MVGCVGTSEVAASTTSLSFGASHGRVWRAKRELTVRNVSIRRLVLRLRTEPGSGSESLRVTVRPARVRLRPGQRVRVVVTVRAARPRVDSTLTGTVLVAHLGSQTLRIPWAIAFPSPKATLLPKARITPARFRPSDAVPAILRVSVGAVDRSAGLQILPVARLDVMLYTATGRFVGVLARLRDLLPGSYSFGITGRDAKGEKLVSGGYEVRLVAWPVLGGAVSRSRVRFGIQ